MRKKIISVSAIFLCLCILLTGCGTNFSGWTKIYKAHKSIALTSAKEYKLNDGLEMYGNISTHGLVIVKNNQTPTLYGVWSMNDQKLILDCTVDNVSNISIKGTTCYDYVLVRTPASISPEKPQFYTVYDGQGNILYNEVANFNITDCVAYNKFVYEFVQVKFLEDTNSNNYLVKVSGFGNENREIIFDESKDVILGRELKSVYELNDMYPDNIQYFYSNYIDIEGNYIYEFYNQNFIKISTLKLNPSLVQNADNIDVIGSYVYYQETMVLPMDSKEYNVSLATTLAKYKINTYSFNIKTGKIIDLKICDVGLDFTNNEELNKNGKDFVKCQKVEDKILISDTYNYYLAENGKLTKTNVVFDYATRFGNYYITSCTYTVNYSSSTMKQDYLIIYNNKLEEVFRLLLSETNGALLNETYFSIISVDNNAIVIKDLRTDSKTKNKYGVIDFKGKNIVNFDYDLIGTFESGYALASKTTTEKNAENKNVYTETIYRISTKGKVTTVATKETTEGVSESTYKFGEENVHYVLNGLHFGGFISALYGYTTQNTAGKYNLKLFNNAGNLILELNDIEDGIVNIESSIYFTWNNLKNPTLTLKIENKLYNLSGNIA